MKKKELSFEAEIEQIIKRPTMSKRSIKEIIEEIYTSEEHSLFFSKIRISPTHRRLFFLHRFDLFGVNGEMQIPYFYLTTIPKKEGREKVIGSRALQHAVSKEVDVVRDSKDVLFSFLGIQKERAAELEEDFKDILAYFTILFIRSNKDLVNLINAKDFNYNIMKTALKNYKNISFDSVGKELSKVFKGEEGEIDPVIGSKIEKIIYQIVSGMAQNLPSLVESSQKLIPNIMLPFHLSSKIWLSTILNKTHLTINDYVNILDDLYIGKLIENKSTIFWCENCSLEIPSYDERHGKIAPSKITKNKCLNCGKRQFYSSVLSLDELLRDAIFSNDGFFFVYFGWLLKKEEIPFVVGEYSSQYENDFIIKNNILIECKVFKLEKDIDAIKSEFENALVMIEKHLASLETDKKKIKYAYLIWNRNSTSEELIDRFKAKYKDLFEKYKFKVFGPEDVEELITELKNK